MIRPKGADILENARTTTAQPPHNPLHNLVGGPLNFCIRCFQSVVDFGRTIPEGSNASAPSICMHLSC